MRLTAVLLLILGMPLASGAQAGGPTCENLAGVWHNQINSTLTFTAVDAATGQLTGTYRAASANPGSERRVIGWINDAAPAAGMDNARVISFSVRFAELGSISTWTGVCRTDRKTGVPTISALFHIARANTKMEYDHIVTNSEVFTPESAAKP